MKKLISVTLIFCLCTTFLFTGCKKDKGDPPVLPPAESMAIDFSNFSTGKKSAEIISDTKGTANSNFDFAATTAGIWKLIISTTLAVPVSSFKAAIGKNPVYLSDKTWQWSYELTVGGNSYKARLTGQNAVSKYIWKMYISRDGTNGFSEFVWFEGESKSDGTGGQWILKRSAAVQEPLLQIDWTKSGDVIGTVKYSYLQNDGLQGSYIEQGFTSADLNAYYTIHYYNGVKFSDVKIEWNTTTKNGRVQSVEYLGDSNWYCWDSNKINATCQ
jgi:hypothetical protein